MPRTRATSTTRRAAKPAPVEPAPAPAVQEPEPDRLCPHGAPAAACPLCALDAMTPVEPVSPDESEAAVDGFPLPVSTDGPVDDETWARLDAEFSSRPSAEFPFDSGETVLSQRVDADAPITYIVTTFGRKVGISQDGWISVLIGPDIDLVVPPVPKPPQMTWKGPTGRA